MSNTKVIVQGDIPKIYLTISELARMVGDKPYNIRYYESLIPDLRPKKVIGGNKGGRRYNKKEVQKVKDFYTLKSMGLQVWAIKKLWANKRTLLKSLAKAEIIPRYGNCQEN